MGKRALSAAALLFLGSNIGSRMGTLIGLVEDKKKRTFKRILGYTAIGGAVGFALTLYNIKMQKAYENHVKSLTGDQSEAAFNYGMSNTWSQPLCQNISRLQKSLTANLGLSTSTLLNTTQPESNPNTDSAFKVDNPFF